MGKSTVRDKDQFANGKTKLPKWLGTHFKESLDAHERLMQIVSLSKAGIAVLRGMPRAIEVLAEIEGNPDDESQVARLERARLQATLAASEVEKDFPVLHAFAVVALWSWAEHLVKHLLVLWLTHRPTALSAPEISRLRIRAGDFLTLRRSEQARLLVELLEQELSTSQRQGPSRFASLLRPVGINVSLDESASRSLFEVQQVRNVIAHRNGKADRRLVSNCPWLGLKVNQPVSVSGKMLFDYSEACVKLFLSLLYGVGDLHGHDLRSKGMSPN